LIFKVLALFVITFSLLTLQGQESADVLIYGNIKDHFSRKKLEGVTVKVTQDGKPFDSQVVSGSGKYEFFLPLNHIYTIAFEKTGMVSKFFELNSKNIPAEDLRGGFSMPADVSLFDTMENVDFTLLKDPIGKAKYEPTRGGMEWDMEYTNRMLSEIARLMREVEKAVADEGKKEDAVAAAALKLEEDYKKLMATGNADMTKKSYESAMNNFKGAMELKPGDAPAKTKYDEAKKKYDEDATAREREKSYLAFIDDADNAFKAKNWQEAIGNYDGALGVKPGEKYPTDQKRLAKAEWDKEKEATVNEIAVAKLIQEGDVEVGKEAYQKGINKFKAALAIIPAHKEASLKLADAEKLLAAYLAEAKEREAYQKLTTEADGLFGSKDYQASIAKYEAASLVLPREVYPKDKIKEAQDLMTNLAAEAAAAKELAEKQARFDTLMKEGESAMTAKTYVSAINKFSDALTVLPDNSKAKERLAAAQKAKDDTTALAEAEDRYRTAIVEADRYFNKTEYEASIEKYREALSAKDEAYPKQKIAEAEKLIKEKAEAAESAEKKSKYDAFMKSADQSMKSTFYDQAIADYTSALGVIPADIPATLGKAAAQKAKADDLAKLEADEKKKAEADALSVKQAEFDGHMATGRSNFKDKTYEKSISSFEKALGVFPDSGEAIDELAKAKKALEDQRSAMADADREAAEAEALAAKQAEYDGLMASAEKALKDQEFQVAISTFGNAAGIFPDNSKAPERIALAEKAFADWKAAQGEAEKLALYAKYMSDAREDMESQSYQDAISDYEGALGVIANDKDAITGIETVRKAIADREAAASADEHRKAEEAAKKAEQDRLRDLADAEAASRRSQEEQDRAYQDAINEADSYFNFKEYLVSKTYYEDALAIKPAEVYPKSRIERIGLLLAKSAADEIERAEREARERELAEANSFNRGSDLSNSTEDDMDARKAEERRKALEEKWAAMERDKEAWKEKNTEISRGAGSRLSENESLTKTYNESGKEMSEQGNLKAEERAENMVGYKEAMMSQDQRREAIHAEKRDDADREFKDFKKQSTEEQERYYGKSSTYAEHQKNVVKIKEANTSLMTRGQETYEYSVSDVQKDEQRYNEYLKLKEAESDERMEVKEKDVLEFKEAIAEQNANALAKDKQKEIEEIETTKEKQKASKERMGSLSEEKRAEQLLEIKSKETYTHEKNPMDFRPSPLLDEYPQGVTEETFEEGNKTVIRRIVIAGNKAYEYHKVVSRSGTYYFKDGLSISIALWDLESNKVPE
jgi:tetratricopeptide (TPR) repeat protein